MKHTELINEIKKNWKNPSMTSLFAIKTAMEKAQIDTDKLDGPLELHRDRDYGFILLAYAESKGTYRIPHDHGRAWVIYVVLEGEVEMGSYSPRLVLKNRERLSAGNSRIYFPGEIHDTRCISENAVILRLTSSDLKEEERLGRMRRYNLQEDL